MKKTNSFLATFVVLVSIFGLIGCSDTTTPNKTTPANSTANSTANAAKTPTAAATPDTTKIASGATPANYKGGQNAAVVVEEFADYQCPTCAQVHPLVQQLNAAFGDRVKFVFRNYPLQQIHPNAYNAAVAAEAAGLQGKFWEMQNLLFTNQPTWAASSDPRKMFEDYAQKIGLDVQKFGDDMAGMAAKKRVDDDMMRARGFNLSSTPSFFVNNKLVPIEALNDFNRFKQIIDAELQKSQSATAANTTTSSAANTTNTAANNSPAKTSATNAEKK